MSKASPKCPSDKEELVHVLSFSRTGCGVSPSSLLHLFFFKSSQKKRQLKNSDIYLETTLYQVPLKREKEDIVSTLHVSHEKR